MEKECVWVTAFVKMIDTGNQFSFERVHIQHIWKTEEEALSKISFCDEAGWYNGVIIEKCALGWDYLWGPERKRHWFIQEAGGNLRKMEEPLQFNNVIHMVF